MNKMMTIIASAILAFGAYADIVQMSVGNGVTRLPYPAKMIGIKAVSPTSSGTINIKEIALVSKSSVTTESITNIVTSIQEDRVGDAFVNQRKVYTGSEYTAWNKWDAIVTNISDTATNVVTYKCAQWHDGSVTNAIVWTNFSCRVEYRDVYRDVTITNVVPRRIETWTHIPFTNQVYNGNLSSGILNASTNILLLGGSNLDVSGTALTNGCAYLIFEK